MWQNVRTKKVSVRKKVDPKYTYLSLPKKYVKSNATYKKVFILKSWIYWFRKYFLCTKYIVYTARWKSTLSYQCHTGESGSKTLYGMEYTGMIFEAFFHLFRHDALCQIFLHLDTYISV